MASKFFKRAKRRIAALGYGYASEILKDTMFDILPDAIEFVSIRRRFRHRTP